MKRILLLAVFLLLVSSIQVSACRNQSATIETIDRVYYDEIDNTYYANTIPNELKESWVVSLAKSNKEDETFTRKLNILLKGAQIKISYDDMEFIDFKFLFE